MAKSGFFIFRDFRTKLITLIVAVGIWYYAHERLETTVVRQANVILRVPSGDVLIHQSVKKIGLSLRGPAPLLKEVGELTLTLDVKEGDMENGRFKFNLLQRFGEMRVNLPQSKRVQLEISPEVRQNQSNLLLQAAISPMVERKLPVKVSIEGEPDRAYKLVVTKADPPKVVVKGPRLILEKMAGIETKELRVWGIKGDQSRVMDLETEREFVADGGAAVAWKLEVRPSRVKVTVTVAQEEVEKTFASVRFVCMVPNGFPFEYEIRENPINVKVRLKGQQRVIEKITKEELIAYVDLSSLAKEKVEPGKSKPYKENVRLVYALQSTVSDEKIEPETVTIWLKNRGKEVK